MDEIRIAIVGLGSRGAGTWLGLLQGLRGYRVVALCDPIEALHEPAMAGVRRPAEVRLYRDYADVLADPEVDAVALTVRCREQGALAAQALEAGKHVNAEVPAAHTMEDCWRIVLAAERSGCVYHLAEQTRYWGFVEAWTALVRSGQLGQITLCEGQYFHYRAGYHFQDPRTGRFFGPHEVGAHPEARPTWGQLMPPIHYLPHELSPMLKVLDDRVVQVVAMSTASPSYAHPEIVQPDMQMALMKTEKDAILRLAKQLGAAPPPPQLPLVPGARHQGAGGVEAGRPRDAEAVAGRGRDARPGGRGLALRARGRPPGGAGERPRGRRLLRPRRVPGRRAARPAPGAGRLPGDGHRRPGHPGGGVRSPRAACPWRCRTSGPGPPAPRVRPLPGPRSASKPPLTSPLSPRPLFERRAQSRGGASGGRVTASIRPA